MLRGIQTSLEAMKVQLARQEVLGRNLVNLNTVGYKQEDVPTGSFASVVDRVAKKEGNARLVSAGAPSMVGSLATKVGLDGVYVDFQQGQLDRTDRTLDVALEGDGFLQVRTPDGDLYFRGGNLQVDGNGLLVTSDGYPVLGVNGEVQVDGTIDEIRADGTIVVGGQEVDALNVVEFDPGTMLAKVGGGMYTPEDPNSLAPLPAINTTVRSGFLESSNADQVATTGKMIELMRAYQANLRMVQAQDELLGKAVNEVGKV